MDLLYRRARIGEIDSLTDFCDALTTMPLLFQPGACWWYGYNHDVLGAIVETLTGETLESYFQRHIFAPISMTETSFWLPPHKRTRVPKVYMRAGQIPGMMSLGASTGDDRGLVDVSVATQNAEAAQISLWAATPDDQFFSGGGGLAGTVGDYHRFAQCMLNGGELDGARILSRKSVQTMVSNQIGRTPHGEPVDMRAKSIDLPLDSYTEVGEAGTGFGLGCAVVLRDDLGNYMTSEGSFSWGGAGSTLFWCDPVEDLVVCFATQFRFRDDFKMPLRALLSNLIYGAIVDGDARGPPPRASKL